jgi:hypothetical protein
MEIIDGELLIEYIEEEVQEYEIYTPVRGTFIRIVEDKKWDRFSIIPCIQGQKVSEVLY